MLTEEEVEVVKEIVGRMLLTPATVFADATFSDGLRVAFKQNTQVPGWPRPGESGLYMKPLSTVVVAVEYNPYKDRFRIEVGDPDTKELGVTFNKPFSVDRFLRGMKPYGWVAIRCSHPRDFQLAKNVQNQLPRCIAVPYGEFEMSDNDTYPDVEHIKPWLDRAMNVT